MHRHEHDYDDLPRHSMKLSSTVVAACRMSLFLEDRLEETVDTVRLMTLFMYSHSGRVTSDITCSACRFTLLLESFRHGMNLSKICDETNTIISWWFFVSYTVHKVTQSLVSCWKT